MADCLPVFHFLAFFRPIGYTVKNWRCIVLFLSLIIPVYNAEKYIGECLDSLLKQNLTAQDYEIICVNDGSKDNSLSVLETYAAAHPNVRIVNKENGGVTTARNAGLDAAYGDYIWFVDADDLVKENILARLKDMVPIIGCDRIVFGAYQFTDRMTEEELEQSRTGQLVTNTSWYDAVVWRCLLRKKFLQDHGHRFRYPELTHGEDGLFMYEVTLDNPVTVYTEEVLYFYRVHSASADHTVSPENRMRKIRSHIRIAVILQEYFRNLKNPEEDSANKLMTFLWNTLYETTQLPARQAQQITKELRDLGLFPYRRPAQCNLETSYMTDTDSLIGRVFDKVYLNLHTPWGYAAMRLMQKLRKL